MKFNKVEWEKHVMWSERIHNILQPQFLLSGVGTEGQRSQHGPLIIQIYTQNQLDNDDPQYILVPFMHAITFNQASPTSYNLFPCWAFPILQHFSIFQLAHGSLAYGLDTGGLCTNACSASEHWTKPKKCCVHLNTCVEKGYIWTTFWNYIYIYIYILTCSSRCWWLTYSLKALVTSPHISSLILYVMVTCPH